MPVQSSQEKLLKAAMTKGNHETEIISQMSLHRKAEFIKFIEEQSESGNILGINAENLAGQLNEFLLPPPYEESLEGPCDLPRASILPCRAPPRLHQPRLQKDRSVLIPPLLKKIALSLLRANDSLQEPIRPGVKKEDANQAASGASPQLTCRED